MLAKQIEEQLKKPLRGHGRASLPSLAAHSLPDRQLYSKLQRYQQEYEPRAPVLKPTPTQVIPQQIHLDPNPSVPIKKAKQQKEKKIVSRSYSLRYDQATVELFREIGDVVPSSVDYGEMYKVGSSDQEDEASVGSVSVREVLTMVPPVRREDTPQQKQQHQENQEDELVDDFADLLLAVQQAKEGDKHAVPFEMESAQRK